MAENVALKEIPNRMHQSFENKIIYIAFPCSPLNVLYTLDIVIQWIPT